MNEGSSNRLNNDSNETAEDPADLNQVDQLNVNKSAADESTTHQLTPRCVDRKYRVVLDCFQGDLTILYHLCKVGEIDVLTVPIIQILQSAEVNRPLTERVFDLVVTCYLLNLKVARVLDHVLKHNEDLLNESDTTLRLAIKNYYSEWLCRATSAFLSQKQEGVNFKYAKIATVKPDAISPSALLKTAKRLLAKKSVYQVYLSTFISNLAQKLRDVLPFKIKILEWLKRKPKVKVRELSKTRLDAIGLFLASLELAKDGNIKIIQQEQDVVIFPASADVNRAASGI